MAKSRATNRAGLQEAQRTVAETIGSLVDKISIMNLKLWHLEDEARRTDVGDAYVAAAKRKIDVANQQRNDLIEELDHLMADYLAERKRPKVYRSLKLYNKNLQREAQAERQAARSKRVAGRTASPKARR